MAYPSTVSYKCNTSSGVYGGVRITPKYKSEASTLFYDAPKDSVVVSNLAYTIARSTVADPKDNFLWGTSGPQYYAVESYSQWKWVNPGGDWLDSTNTSQGTSPCWSFNANAVTSGSHTYTVDVTTAIQQCYILGKWNAWIVKCTQNRSWASNHSSTPPTLTVNYTDGYSEVLPCIASSKFAQSSSYTYIGIPSISIWAGSSTMEFDRPRRPVTSASLQITIDTHSATAASITGFLANPPNNVEGPTTGLSVNYPGDTNISSDPNVLLHQSYIDGSSISDFIALSNQGNNLSYLINWSPHMCGLGAADTNKLPYKLNGVDITNKFVHAALPSIPPTLVTSSYTGQGFYPLTPGVGALKIVIPGNGAADGAVVGSAGGLGADLHWYLSEPDCGNLDTLYCRYYILIGTYPETPVKDLKMYRNSSNGSAIYIGPRGKIGPNPHHHTYFGGNNRYGGGNTGWSSRGIYISNFDLDPNTLAFGWHALDMWTSDPNMWAAGAQAQLQGGCMWSGQQGSYGVRLKRGVWYCVETYLKLNTWNDTWDTAPSHDGEYKMWLDGVKVIDYNGFSFRQGPLNYTDPTISSTPAAILSHHDYTPTTGNNIPPFRQLGHVGIWLNDYQGGITSCEFDQTIFYSNLVVSKTRIGPMA